MPSRLERFKSGYRTCDDLVRDAIRIARGGKPSYLEEHTGQELPHWMKQTYYKVLDIFLQLL